MYIYSSSMLPRGNGVQGHCLLMMCRWHSAPSMIYPSGFRMLIPASLGEPGRAPDSQSSLRVPVVNNWHSRSTEKSMSDLQGTKPWREQDRYMQAYTCYQFTRGRTTHPTTAASAIQMIFRVYNNYQCFDINFPVFMLNCLRSTKLSRIFKWFFKISFLLLRKRKSKDRTNGKLKCKKNIK